MDKALSLLSLCRKGGNIAIGEEPVGAEARANRARLIVVARDASDHTVRRVRSYVAGTNQPWIALPYCKDELGEALGVNVCAMAAITDVRLALAFAKSLDSVEPTLLEELSRRAERVTPRQKEEKAHRRNVKIGKKHR